MRWSNCAAALVIAMAVAGGCKKEEAPTTPAKPATPQTGPMSNAMKEAEKVAGKVADETKDAANAVKNSDAGQAVADAAADTKDAAANALDAAKNSDTANALGEAGALGEAKAKELIDQAIAYAKENKWDLAESTLAQAEKFESQLPASIKPHLETARKMIADHKAAAAQ